MQRLLTLSEAAELLRTDPIKLRRLARRGRVGGAIILPSGETRFDCAALEAWLAQQMTPAEGGQR
jgi:hypothetical protein